MSEELINEYKIPDEKLSYSELKDRIRKEVTDAYGKSLKKERIMLIVKKLEDDITIKDTICHRICTDFGDLISEQYIRRNLPDEYKCWKKRRNSGANSQKLMTIDTGSILTDQGINTYTKAEMRNELAQLREENLRLKEEKRDMARNIQELERQLAEKTEQVAKLTEKNEISNSLQEQERKKAVQQQKIASDVQEREEETSRTSRANHNSNIKGDSELQRSLQQKLSDLTEEKDSLSSEAKILKEKSQPELLHELLEKFYDEPGMVEANKLKKTDIESGENFIKSLQRYRTIIQSAVESGQPVPLVTYVMAKPKMKLVPVRLMVDFNKEKIEIALWEKKLQSLA
jgi:myosin heavy subunit